MEKIGPAFTLAQLIEKAADELKNVKKKPLADAGMQFAGCELELAVTPTAEAGGEIKFWLVGASEKATGETVSKIRLSFGPIPVAPETDKPNLLSRAVASGPEELRNGVI